MKIKRKICAIVMTAALILTLLPAMAFAADETSAKPVEAYYNGSPSGHPGAETVSDLYVAGNLIEVTYDDASVKEFVYGTYNYKDDNGVTQKISGFLEKVGENEYADPGKFENYALVNVDYDEFKPLKEGSNDIQLIIDVPCGTDENGYLQFETFYQTMHIWIKVDRPVEVNFVPAAGFKVKGNIGYNYLNEVNFYGKGNMFTVKYEYIDDPEVVSPSVGYYTAEYKYYKSKDGSVEGFFDNGNPKHERFEMFDGVDCYLKKGLNKGIEFTYYGQVEGQNEPEPLTFTSDVYGEKYEIFADDEYISTYTGKAIKQPKFKLYNSDDKLIPSYEYTYKTPTAKSIGWHTLKVKIKDKYKKKYAADTVFVLYGIGPKAPTLTKLTPGKGSITVNWKKMTSAQLKKIDGFYIMLSTDKHFLNNTKKVWVSKKDFKSGKKQIKKLKRGKGYYVKMYAYKKTKQYGSTFKMPSKYSKRLYKKTK